MNKLIKEKIGNSNRGSKNGMFGATPWNKGKKFIAMIGNTNGFKKGQAPWNKGLKGIMPNHTEERKILMKKLLIGRKKSDIERKHISDSKMGSKNPMFGKHLTEEHKRKIGKNFGKDNPAWKGGITKESALIRSGIEINLWKQSVMARDNWTCQKTGIKGGRLELHHIFNFADYPELRTSIENGITLSKESHKEFHKIYGKRNNTKQQLEEFLIIK